MNPQPRIVLAPEAAALAPALLGGKAANLAEMARAGFPVPPWFAVTTAVFRDVIESLRDGIEDAVRGVDFDDRCAVEAASARIRALFRAARLREGDRALLLERFDGLFPKDAFVSVRSSAVGEDSAKDSFAGQMDSYLFVDRARVEARLLECFGSAFSARALLYRKLRGLDPASTVEAAAVVQLMVESRVSGILFTANPTTGDRTEVVVAAGLGLGEGVVQDIVESDTYFLDGKTGAVRERAVAEKRSRVAFDRAAGGGTVVLDVAPEEGDRPALTDAELARLCELGRRIEAHRGGVPQDIEWALDGGSSLYLLQTRPITTLGDGAAKARARPERETVFDNSNIVESYPGLSLPLTFTFAREAYEHTFRECSRRLGTSERDIAEHHAVHEHLVSLIDGRIYYDISNWYRIFEMIPGLEGAIPAWEQALGLRKRFTRRERVPLGTRLWRLPGILRVAWRLTKRFVLLSRDVRRFQADFAALYEEFRAHPLAEMSAHDLLALYDRLARRVMTGYAVALVNDFYAQQLYAIVGKLIERYGLGDPSSLRNDLLCGEEGMESVEPVRSALALAGMIRADPKLRALFEEPSAGRGEGGRGGSPPPVEPRPEREVLAAIEADPAFAKFREAYARHIALYGERTLHELKLETPLMEDDPTFFVTMLRNYVRGGQDVEGMERREREIRAKAEAALAKGLAGHPLRAAIFRFALKHSRKTVRYRENTRLLRSRAFGIVKRIFRELGRVFVEEKLLDDPHDIFWLGLEEVQGQVRGHAITRDLRALVALRKREYDAFKRRRPAARIVTRGVVYAPKNDFEGEGSKAARTAGPAAGGTELRGIGCSPGKVRAKAKVILSPDQDMRVDGEVLVAPMTDPGWVFLMIAAGGIVSEKGSLLSHTAIIGRELGIPTVVGVKDATKRIADGEVVELDGQAGVVRIVRETAASPVS